ncbi:MAG: hypothetical protein HYZ37_04130, partial [Candidatus Solibacter usitatus]|nr:hypothetical protein [Candidatus Solibacter usitatus]
LVEDGAIIVKLWFHLSKKAQRRRLEELEASPETHWRVLPTDWKHHKLYDRFIEISERALRQTDTAKAPWHLIEAVDRRYRELTAAAVILEAIRQRLPSATSSPAAAKAIPKPARLKEPAHILDKVNLNQVLSDETYAEQLAQYQGTLSRLAWKASKQKISTVALFEGWDAAGKGSAIRRVTQAIDPRLYQIIPIAAPTHAFVLGSGGLYRKVGLLKSLGKDVRSALRGFPYVLRDSLRGQFGSVLSGACATHPVGY